MNPSGDCLHRQSFARKIQELQQALKQMRAEYEQSQNMTQQVTQTLRAEDQNNAALQERLYAQSSV